MRTRKITASGAPCLAGAALLCAAQLLGAQSGIVAASSDSGITDSQRPSPPCAAENCGPAPTAQLYKLPLSFEENRGQAGRKVRYFSRGRDYSLFLTDHAAVIASGTSGEAVTVRTTVSNRYTRARGEQQLQGKVNYLSGPDSSEWLTNVPTYANVRYAAVYPGIDLLYHGNRQQVEFDFVVEPEADPNRIRLHLSGARSLHLNAAGDLLVGVAGGTLLLHKPLAYQQVNSNRIPVESAFEIGRQNTVRFSLKPYDRTNTLIIDPTLSYATYLGGANVSNASGLALAVDASGSTYVTGSTNTVGFPITPGAFQTGTFAGKTAYTGFVTKLNAAGTALVYSTYLGGENADSPAAIAVDASGNTYVAGVTGSKSFPTTKGALQTSCVSYCGFISKLSPSGTSLIYSTYLGAGAPGGFVSPIIGGIALNAAGNAYVTGRTPQTFPTTPGALQTSGTAGGFLAELATDGGSLVYSTLLGGVGSTFVVGIAVDKAGNAYVTGFSTAFPTTSGAYQTGSSGGGFLAKIDPLGAKFIYSTLIGAIGLRDTPSSVAVDASGNAYIAGLAYSGAFPTTPGAFQTRGSGLFVTKFNATGSALIYSTFLNPSGSPSGFLPVVAVDGSGNAYVTGLAGGGLPVTTDALAKNGGGAFLTILNSAGNTAMYSSYIGGDEGTSIALDSSGNVYIAGIASSANVPVTTGAFQTKQGGLAAAAFVEKFSSAASATPVISGVVNAASSVPGIVPGSFGTIYGSNLSPATQVWDNAIVNGALPTSLGGVSVSVAGKPAYISYVSPGQLNFLAPNISPGSAAVTVTTPAGTSAPYSSTANSYQPAFFLIPGNQPVATHLDYTLAAKNGTYAGVTTVPAQPGETIILWGTGFGPTSPLASDGMVVPSQPTYSTATLPGVTVSSQPARVLGAALAPGFAGLYQIAVQLPSSLPNGDWPILANAGGVQSETGIVLTVQP